MKRYNILIIVLLSICSLSLFSPAHAAGRRVAGHFQMEAGAGAVLFPYNQKEVGTIVGGAQIDLTAKYNYLFNGTENWGLSVGVGLNTFQGAQTLNEELLYPTVDDEGFPYILMAKVSNWYEKQQSYAVTIPVGIFYQNKSRYSDVGFLTSLNIKATIPFYSRYKVVLGDITTKGDYGQWGGTILENLPQHGFGTSSDFHPSGSLKSLVYFSAEYQIGMLFTFDRKTEMFLTAYLEHGFTNMFKSMPDRPLFNSLSSYNGYYGSMYGKNTIPVMVGIKIGFRIIDIHGCNCIRY